MADETLASNVALFNLMTPADGAAAITPHDTNALAYTSRALYVGGAGNLVVVMKNNDEVTFNSVPAGAVLSIRVKKVKSTGTTATNIISLY
ncbi:MAG TPA: hypothetical protein VF297_05285 [Pyrinomonadaceae bacterium]